jgi:hypothetical protein
MQHLVIVLSASSSSLRIAQEASFRLFCDAKIVLFLFFRRQAQDERKEGTVSLIVLSASSSSSSSSLRIAYLDRNDDATAL